MKRRIYKRKRKPPFRHVSEFDLVVFCTTLLVLLAANFFVAILVIPLIFFASTVQSYLLLAAVGLAFGYVFESLISGIKGMRTHHHMVAILLIPAFAIVTLVAVSASMPQFATIFETEPAKDPVTLSIFYAVFFVMPYFALGTNKRKAVKRKR